jgi:hypothetical protein
MAKTKISEYSATSADNTDIGNINIAEGCSPSNVNNAIRTIMAQLKDQQDGTSGDPFTVGGNLSVTGTSTLTGNVTAPTQTSSDNSTKVATTAFVTTKINALGTMASQNATAVAITGGTITGITDLTVADGGTGASSITANSVILGNGTSALSGNLVAPSTSGNILTSNGTTWTSAAPAGSLGVGQTWQDVTSSRTSGTTYTNSTGKPIMVSAYLDDYTSDLPVIRINVDGLQIARSDSGTGTSAIWVSAIVPNGSTYVITKSGVGTFNVFELR